MNGVPWSLAGNFVVLIALQITGISLLPRTHGFTNAGATIAVLALFAMSYWLMARIVQSGVTLGILLPLMAAAVPLGSVAAGVIFFGESASQVKIVLLICACLLIGFAARY